MNKLFRNRNTFLWFVLLLSLQLKAQQNRWEFNLVTGIKIHNPYTKDDLKFFTYQKPKLLLGYVASSPLMGAEIVFNKKSSVEYRKSIWARAVMNSPLGNLHRLTTNDLFFLNRYIYTKHKLEYVKLGAGINFYSLSSFAQQFVGLNPKLVGFTWGVAMPFKFIDIEFRHEAMLKPSVYILERNLISLNILYKFHLKKRDNTETKTNNN